MRLLLDRGVLTRDSRQWWIERDREIATEALPRLRDELGLWHVEIVHGLLEEFDPPEPVDYVDADLMGALGIPTGRWLAGMAARGRFAPDATLVMTVTAYWRNSPFSHWAFREITEGTLGETADEFASCIAIGDRELLLPRVLLSCALRTCSFRWVRNLCYGEAGSPWRMTTMRVDGIRSSETPLDWPEFDALARAFTDQHAPRGQASGDPGDDPAPLRAALLSLHGLDLLAADDACRRLQVVVPRSGRSLATFGSVREVRSAFGL